MSHQIPRHLHPRGITLALGPITATLPDGSSDSSTAASTTTPPPSPESSKTSKSSKSSKSAKGATSSKSSTSSTSSFPDIAAPVSSSSTSSITSTPTLITSSVTSTSTTSQLPASAATSAAASSPHSSGTNPGLVVFAVIASIAFVGAVVWVILMRRHHKQREWTFAQHQRIFERFEKIKESDNRPTTSHTVESIYPPVPVPVVEHSKAWPPGTGAGVITTGPSVIRNLDWDQGPEQVPQRVVEEKPRRKPVPPPKDGKRKTKTFSQYVPFLLPQYRSAEVIELGKAQAQVYQRPNYKPAG